MTEVDIKSGYFNAELIEGTNEPDITYNASDLNEYFEGLISSKGIFATVSNACQVKVGSGLSVTVYPGRGIVDSHWFKNEIAQSLELATADVILNRIDRIIIRCDHENRKVTLKVLTGTLAETPVAPSLGENEISLAQVYVGKNKTSITASNITDERSNDSVCGWITTLIEQFSTETLFDQYQDAQRTFINEQTAEFYSWFEEMQEELNADAVVSEINGLKEQVANVLLYDNLNYYATGEDDNIEISNIVKYFLDGAFDYSNVKDNASMYLFIHGEIQITNLVENQMAFDFHSSVESNRRVIVDFGNATITYNNPEYGDIFAVFGSENNVTIRNANVWVDIEGSYDTTFYGFHGGIIKDCKIYINPIYAKYIYGAYNAGEFSNNKLTMAGGGISGIYGVYECQRVQFNDITTPGLSSSFLNYAVKQSEGFLIGNNITGSTQIDSSVIDLGNIKN